MKSFYTLRDIPVRCTVRTLGRAHQGEEVQVIKLEGGYQIDRPMVVAHRDVREGEVLEVELDPEVCK